ncbi:hypothetical protein PTKIN_Ptkin05aG0184000 [Pterospermum kingtungense]
MAKTTQQGVKDHLHVPNFEVPISGRHPCHRAAFAMLTAKAILDTAWSIASESLNGTRWANRNPHWSHLALWSRSLAVPICLVLLDHSMANGQPSLLSLQLADY